MSLKGVYTASEADEVWGLPPRSVKRDCLRGVFLKGEYAKSKSHWLITEKALIAKYGKPKGAKNNEKEEKTS